MEIYVLQGAAQVYTRVNAAILLSIFSCETEINFTIVDINLCGEIAFFYINYEESKGFLWWKLLHQLMCI